MGASRLSLMRPFLTHPTPVAMGALAVSLAVAFRATLFSGWGALAFLAGLALFIPQEYLSHRFFLHARPSARPRVRRAQDRLHYKHHENPDDVRILFGPLWAVIPTAALYWLLYLAVLRDAGLASSVSVGGLVAYVWYEYTHFVAHSPIVPFTRWGKHLKVAHLWHHHKNEFYWFGVTTRTADVVAGTDAPVHAVPQSATVRDIPRSKA